MTAPASTGPRTLRLGSATSLQFRPRTLAVGVAIGVVTLVVAAASLMLGKNGLTAGELWGVLTGSAELSRATEFSLERLSGPRLFVALGAGAALGISGSLFQTVTRNPLGSPEIVGLTAGAGGGAAAAGVLWPGIVPLPVGAVLGGAVAVTLVWFSTGRGFSAPGRLIIAGIAVSAICSALTGLALTKAGEQQAEGLAFYLSGTLASRAWGHVAQVWVVLLVVLPFVLAIARNLNLVQLGDELADSLGGRSNATRSAAICAAVLLAGAAVAVCGPVSFVALVAPQVAMRLTRAATPGVIAPALVGALLLTLADMTVQNLPQGVNLPVGIVTAGIGSIYLGYLLATEMRRGTL